MKDKNNLKKKLNALLSSLPVHTFLFAAGPTDGPTTQPSSSPSSSPSAQPSSSPSAQPSSSPSAMPSQSPTDMPSLGPTTGPTSKCIVQEERDLPVGNSVAQAG